MPKELGVSRGLWRMGSSAVFGSDTPDISRLALLGIQRKLSENYC